LIIKAVGELKSHTIASLAEWAPRTQWKTEITFLSTSSIRYKDNNNEENDDIIGSSVNGA
jgi:hypothetical protein